MGFERTTDQYDRMKPYVANLINGVLLVAISSWGYFGSETPSGTALIPAVIGVLLLLCNGGVKRENKVIAHVAVLLTILAIAGNGMALKGAMGRDDMMAVTRVGIMMASCVVATVAFVKSFIAARRS